MNESATDAPKVEAMSMGGNDVGNAVIGVSTAAAHSDNEVFLFLANTAAVTDSIAAATLRGVTIICGRIVNESS